MTELPRRALSVRQPKAYLAGCLKGDAFMSVGHKNSVRGYIGLRVSDWDFAHAFAESINAAYGLSVSPRTDERGYALVRTYNGHGRFDELSSLLPECEFDRASWLRGLFDSEGNVVCAPKPKRGPQSWDRRVAMFSTNAATLDAAHGHLSAIGIEARLSKWACGPGHLGDKPVMAVILRADQHNFKQFAEKVGSSITRKALGLNRCHSTYGGVCHE